MWGAVQPVAGALADRYGSGRVLAGSLVVLAIGCALTPLLTSAFGLMLTMGILFAAGAGGAGFSVLIGSAAQHVPANKRGTAAGVINAGGSFGQFVFAPLVQKLISVFGWAGALWSLAVLTLAALPLTRVLRRSPEAAAARAATETDGGLRRAVGSAFKDRSYLLLHAGFFTCGFHIAFLVIHLPSEVGLCGLPASVASWSLALIGLANIVGSLVAGQWVNRYRSKYILFWMYFSRTVLILIYLAAPKTAMTFYIFAIGLGVTWLATVPPTAGVVGKLFGVRYLVDALWADAANASDWRVFRRVSGRHRRRSHRQLFMDVVRRRAARACCSAGQPADSRAEDRTARHRRKHRSIVFFHLRFRLVLGCQLLLDVRRRLFVVR